MCILFRPYHKIYFSKKGKVHSRALMVRFELVLDPRTDRKSKYNKNKMTVLLEPMQSNNCRALMSLWSSPLESGV